MLPRCRSSMKCESGRSGRRRTLAGSRMRQRLILLLSDGSFMMVESSVENPPKVDQLDRLTMMRRANGELFTLTLKGRTHLALWPSPQRAFYYKARNPELLVFSPALVASPFGQKRLAALQREDMGLFLLTDTGRAHLSDGCKISWEEIKNGFPASSL